MKTTKFILALAVSVVLFSCSKQDNDDEVNFSADEASVNSRIDIANDDVSDIVEGQFDATLANPTSGKSTETAAAAATNLPACVTVTRVPLPGTPITVGTLVTKTVDFGPGCPMPNGNVLRGKIIVTFTYNPNATTHVINYEFVNFYHNAIKFDGNKTFSRSMTAATAASPSHPIVVMTMDMTGTFPDGRVFTRVGTRTREIIAGYNTPLVFLDNIYRITGTWTTTRPNTTVQTSTITTPLLVKMSCIQDNKPLIVSGVISFVRNNQTATLDYGNGDCDNLAVFTFNGVSYTIVIGN